MLLELSVQNLVIVAAARLAPGAGLTVISGETGAGKSLLLDALDLLLGGRAQASLVGPAGDSATVTAVFAVDDRLAPRIEAAAGVPAADGQVIVRRRIAEGGRSQAWINDVPVTAAALRGVGSLLVEVRQQNEALRLGEPARQLALLDSYGGLAATADAYGAAHARVCALEAELARLDGGERESLKELDWLRFQAEEFAALDPKPGEVADLEARQRTLSSVGEWQALAAQASEALGDGPRSVVAVCGGLVRKLGEAPDHKLVEAGEACRQAQEAAREAARLCSDALDRLQADPGELARIEERLDAYYQLMRKHGEGEAALLAARDAVVARVGELEGIGERRERVAADLAAARAARGALGKTLAQARAKAFARFAKAVHGELADLGMPKARLTLGEDESAPPSALGLIRQEFLVCTNPGLPPGALAAIASGGEASRLTLAIAVVAAEHDRTPVLVFDEIDSGVGGRLGAALGAKLATLAANRTVLAITHTPQLAAAASRHYVVRKMQDDRRTTASVHELTEATRTAEIADMLGGGSAALGQAKALLGKGAG
jgi:DNA repair protein RecN (Recombination protein N)